MIPTSCALSLWFFRFNSSWIQKGCWIRMTAVKLCPNHAQNFISNLNVKWKLFVGSKPKLFISRLSMSSFVLDFICDRSKIKPRSISPRSINNWFCEIYSNRFIACFDTFLWWFALPIAQFFILAHFLCLDFYIPPWGWKCIFPPVRETWKWFASETTAMNNGTKYFSLDLMITRLCPFWAHRIHNTRNYQPLNGCRIKILFLSRAIPMHETQTHKKQLFAQIVTQFIHFKCFCI